jgi:nitric oxide reductase large subunit
MADKIQEFWDIIACRLAAIDQRFREAYCLHCQDEAHQIFVFDCFTLKEQATIYQLTQCHITDDSNLQQLFTFYPMTSMAAKNNFTEYLYQNVVDV